MAYRQICAKISRNLSVFQTSCEGRASTNKSGYFKSQGVDHVLDDHEEDVEKRVKEDTEGPR